MALPAETRRRWGIAGGGAVEIADLGTVLVVVPAGRGGLRSMLSEALEDAGGYRSLARRVADSEPDLA
jgi:bifunctional DNA-binding transcriptional regulator/antitoxin component of YhaV-PrlF toxin-antitoxin module